MSPVFDELLVNRDGGEEPSNEDVCRGGVKGVSEGMDGVLWASRREGEGIGFSEFLLEGTDVSVPEWITDVNEKT